jgi:hypothetical protein
MDSGSRNEGQAVGFDCFRADLYRSGIGAIASGLFL